MKINDKYDVLFEARTGSHLYGTNTPTSDEDFCGVILPVSTEVFGFEKMEELNVSIVSKDAFGKNTEDAIDRKFYEFRKFIKLAMENNPNILELLFANKENIIYNNDAIDLFSMRSLFPNKEFIHTKFLGYARSQKHLMTQKPENYANLIEVQEYLYNYLGVSTIVNMSDDGAISKSRQLFVELKSDIENNKVPVEFKDSFIKIGDINLNKNLNIKNVITYIETRLKTAGSRKKMWEEFGFDVKFGMHLHRLLMQAEELLRTGDLVFPLTRREELMDVRMGKMSLDEVINKSYDLEAEVDMAYVGSSLRSKPEYNKIQDFVVSTLKLYFK